MKNLEFFLRRMWSFSRALDLALVDEEIEKGFQFAIGQRHGERVAYIALTLGKQMGLNGADLLKLTVAGLLHDIGAVADFRLSHGNTQHMARHSLIGASMMEKFPLGESLSPVIRYHHETPDPKYGVLKTDAREVPLFARILSLADKLDVHMPRHLLKHSEREELLRWAADSSGHQLFPEVVEALLSVASREAFWLDLEQPDLVNIILGYFGEFEPPLSAFEAGSGFVNLLAETFAELVDQKSNFTARHSHSVAENVRLLAAGLNWEKDRQHQIYAAGLLHDLGKLAVPNRILDKPGKLDKEEFDIIRTHTYYTHRLLTEAGFPANMINWAAYHHERLDGQGYPFALQNNDLDTGSKLMTIADIFTALTEERPYRKGLSSGQALEIIQSGVGVSVDEQLFEVARRVL